MLVSNGITASSAEIEKEQVLIQSYRKAKLGEWKAESHVQENSDSYSSVKKRVLRKEVTRMMESSGEMDFIPIRCI